MLAIKKARKLIEKNPAEPTSLILAELVLALETSTPFALGQLYQLDYKRFELAMEILGEWRLDQYYASKLRLIDASNQVQEMHQTAPTPVPQAAKVAQTTEAPGI